MSRARKRYARAVARVRALTKVIARATRQRNAAMTAARTASLRVVQS